MSLPSTTVDIICDIIDVYTVINTREVFETVPDAQSVACDTAFKLSAK